MLTGVCTLAHLLNPNIKVIGVEPYEANCMQESIKQGHVVTLNSANTIADGTAVKTPGDFTFSMVSKYIDSIITVNDEELIGAYLDMVENQQDGLRKFRAAYDSRT